MAWAQFRVILKVRATRDHPLFWEFSYGYLALWLGGRSPEDAGRRAIAIVAQLPYEIEEPAVVHTEPIPLNDDEQLLAADFDRCEAAARNLGLSMYFATAGVAAELEDIKPTTPNNEK